MIKTVAVINKLVIGLGLALLLGAEVEAAPVVSNAPAGISASEGMIVKTGVVRRSARRTTHRHVRRRVY